MIGSALIAALGSAALIVLLYIYLSYRAQREQAREAASARARSEATFRSNGYTPHQILYYSALPRQIQLLADNRSGILRIDTLSGEGRRDLHFRDLIGCQVLENGLVVKQVGKSVRGNNSSVEKNKSLSDQVQAMRLVMHLSDALEPAVGIDLIFFPVSRSTSTYQQAKLFTEQVLTLTQYILEGDWHQLPKS